MKFLMERPHAAADRAGFLQSCAWQPASRSELQSCTVGFRTPEEPVLDGLALSTEYAMAFSASAFLGLTTGEVVLIAGHAYPVRKVRAIGDGSEKRATLTRL